ncbi:DUF6808 domain-containing protein [Chitinophagaceae bacterium MMS25-I14]
MNKTFIICILLLLLISFLSVRSCIALKRENAQLEQVVQHGADDSLYYYRDRYAREHAERLSLSEGMEQAGKQQQELLDSISRTLNTSKKSIVNAAAVSVQSQQAVLLKTDTFFVSGSKEIHFSYKDKWINMNGLLSDTPQLHYETFDSLVVTTYKKKTGRMKHEMFINAWSLNPHSRITGLTDYRIPQEKPLRWSVGPYVGYGFDGTHWQPSVGISIQYGLIRF